MTILETISVIEQPGNYGIWLLMSLIGTMFFLFLAGILFIEEFELGGIICTTLSAISLIILIISIFLTITEPAIDTGRKQYIIKLDDTISINEFYDKYKIIEHPKYSNIYTVEELEND